MKNSLVRNNENVNSKLMVVFYAVCQIMFVTQLLSLYSIYSKLLYGLLFFIPIYTIFVILRVKVLKQTRLLMFIIGTIVAIIVTIIYRNVFSIEFLKMGIILIDCMLYIYLISYIEVNKKDFFKIYFGFICVALIVIVLLFNSSNYVLLGNSRYLLFGFSNQNSAGINLFMVYIYLLIGIKFFKRRVIKGFLWILSSIILISIALTGARSSFFSALIILLIYLFNIVPSFKFYKLIYKFFILIPVLVPIFYIFLWNSSLDKNIMLFGKPLFSSRQVIWIAAFEIFKFNPLTSHYGQFQNVANSGTYAHNIYISIWWEYGIIGLLLVMIVLYLLFKNFLKKATSQLDFMIFSSLGLILLQQSFEETLFRDVWLYTMVFGLFTLNGMNRHVNADKSAEKLE